MDIVKEANDMLTDQDHQERMNKLSLLADLFEYERDLDNEKIIESIKLLLIPAVQEKAKDVKEAFFYAIDAAVVHRNIEDSIDWDVLAEALPSLEKDLLGYVLNILGISGQEKYLPIMHTYARDSDPEIREWAEEGIQEITYRLAHRDDAPSKEE